MLIRGLLEEDEGWLSGELTYDWHSGELTYDWHPGNREGLKTEIFAKGKLLNQPGQHNGTSIKP